MTQYQKNLKNFQKEIEREPALIFINKLFQKFPKIEVYLVGGAVRDAALGLPDQNDYDFVVRYVKAKDLEKFLARLGRVDLVGKTFGVFKFVPQKNKLKTSIDIALPRTEHSLDFRGGYRDFQIQSNHLLPIEKDLARRDFTINALAWEVKAARLIDPTGGLEDLKNKKIRTVGDPSLRLQEDYSRLLRALRFACQLDFKIEQKTFNALKNLMKHINDQRRLDSKEERVVPYEVVSRELLKSFYFDPVRAFDLYEESGAFGELIPEVHKMKGCPQPKNWHSEGDVWVHTRLTLSFLKSKEFAKQFPDREISSELVMAALFHDLGKPYTIKTPEKDGTDRIRFDGHDLIGAQLVREIGQRLRFSAAFEVSCDPEKVAWLVAKHILLIHGDVRQMRASTIEKYFFSKNLPGENLLKLFFVDALATISQRGQPDLTNFRHLLKRIAALKKLSKTKTVLPRPLVNGHEIMTKLNLTPGPQIGQLLSAVREEQLKGRIKTKKEAFQFLAGQEGNIF